MDVRSTKYETMFFVTSETGEGEYQLVLTKGVWKCTCRAYQKVKQPCKHIQRLLEYLKERDGGVEPEEEEGMSVPSPSTPTPSKWVKRIHGRDFITYEGLLAMAHEQGLISLGAKFVSVTLDLALAEAYADFKDGRAFVEAADASPHNVGAQVKAHFPRIALTRAKARCLSSTLSNYAA